MVVFLFLLGLAVGSFLNVVALRYDGEHFTFNPKIIGGRSRCPHCRRTLRWFELIPLVSFLVQRGRCKDCRSRIGFHYPIVELISGFIFILVPAHFGGDPALSTLWIVAFEILLLMTYIDIRLQIVPDELSVVLGVVAIFAAIFSIGTFGPTNISSLAGYAEPFGLQNNFLASHIAGALFGAGFFIFLILVTRGKGMGWGDVKLALPLGFLFGWPDIPFLYGVAFIVGALVGIFLLARKEKTMKSALPFVPFLAIGAAFIFFLGAPAIGWYFNIIGL